MTLYYIYHTWHKPNLSDAEEIALGKQIHLNGKNAFPPPFQQNTVGEKQNPLALVAILAAVSVGIYFLLSTKRGIILLGATLLLSAFSVITLVIAKCRYNRWLVELESKYLAARGDNRDLHHTPPTHHTPPRFVRNTASHRTIKILAVLTVVWLLLFLVLAINESAGKYNSISPFVTIMGLGGILPPLLVWGAVWVLRSHPSK
jgi:membrane protein YdbS with pleckstrin-like domain